MGFLLGPIGVLIACVLPERERNGQEQKRSYGPDARTTGWEPPREDPDQGLDFDPLDFLKR